MFELSICIPTYRRPEMLRETLAALEPQVRGRDDVEVVVVDNASGDETTELVAEFRSRMPGMRVHVNPVNVGMDGNTARCIELATGRYVALLADDDLYAHGEVDRILSFVRGKDFSLVLLNYYAFHVDAGRSLGVFAPERDVVFPDPMDVIRYPSVGHYSGFVYRTDVAQAAVREILAREPLTTADRSRGMYLHIAVTVAKRSPLPAAFMGAPGVAARMTVNPEYVGLEETCLSFVRSFAAWKTQGLVGERDFRWVRRLAFSRLPRAIAGAGAQLPARRIREIDQELRRYLGSDPRYWLLAWPMFVAVRTRVGRAIARVMRTHARRRLFERIEA
jgi:glycosyltransferase involved in cell wall biosynthesis